VTGEERDVSGNFEQYPQSNVGIGEILFRYRDYTPIPLIVLLFIFCKPTALSATLGLLAIALGEVIRIYSVAFIGSISRTRKDHTGARLIKEGPFGYVRNPLYVGNFFIATGVAVFAGRPWLIVLSVLLFAVQYYFIVTYEEAILLDRFGEEYETYRQSVPAWIPSHPVEIDDIVSPPALRPALRSESQTLMAIGGMITLLLVFG